MKEAEKIAISVERTLLRRAERLRAKTGESRSAVIARALRTLLSVEDQQRQVAEYVDGYRRQPESPGDVERARASARKTLASLSWEDE